MTRWTRRLVATGEESDAFGPDPKGFMSYDLAGRLMVIVVRGSRIRPESSLPTDAEKLALFDSMFAYAGTYRVEPDRIVHELDTSWNELWSGSRQTRFYSWDGKRLVYTSPPTVDPLDGQECVYTITWEKIGRERS
ncbi:MAG: hypothetical protein GC151_17020 [Betaproteobacteria bacterium]|nr:hypothetical protein [Betaproteobacteria bacterium]